MQKDQGFRDQSLVDDESKKGFLLMKAAAKAQLVDQQKKATPTITPMPMRIPGFREL